MTKTKTVLKITFMWCSLSKGKQPGQESAVSLKKESFRHFLILSVVRNRATQDTS